MTRIRVAAYVIRHRAVPELLVFDHVGMPEAGTQIPAGGVHPGERLEHAVLRELAEETGMRSASVIRQVAAEDTTTYFHLHALPTTPDAWTHTVQGQGDDAGLTFSCRFVPLPLEHPLTGGQDAWLDRIDARWTAER
ncbi:NUDIX domain-containing protein [Actinomadura graeca]|uniref:NUDIX domain-containing protein n=1 Tax=Actinomadura graeca TaxID=2750812 RepID=A0ABX8R1D1_9ACTN|nr:NUDIX domain-containing protein [Actinomadura graeca]QXJ24069.1 NUDIX domain-containing protein [Actinomadura graeca]